MIKKFFSAIAVLAVLFTSCEMLTGEGETMGKFHFTSNATVDVVAGGNCLVLSYAIDEAVEGAKVTATSRVDWVKDLAVNEEDCCITFCVKENEGEARTGAIDVVYAGCTQSITVNQEAASASKIELSTNDTVEVAAGGNCLLIPFVINEVVEGAEVEAVSADEWVYDVTVNNEDSCVTFCVKTNKGEARTTTVTISYADDSAVVTVNQQAAIAE